MDHRRLAQRLPFYYGKVVLGCAMCASFARQATAVATLSVFIVPMTVQFDWSRAEISGAVSLGGILGALVAPVFGVLVDRKGARAVLTFSTIAIAATAFALASTESLLWFYVFFSLGRMLFAGPFDIAVSAAVANWFVRKRAQAMSIVALTIGLSLAAMPFIAQLGIANNGWRSGWILVALATLVVGALPNALFMVRRPEDIGLLPDGEQTSAEHKTNHRHTTPSRPEVNFSLRRAMGTPALWLLMLYTALVFMVQAGISLHQAPHLIQRGIDPTIAASIVSTFALVAASSGLLFGWLGGRWPIRFAMALAAMMLAAGALLAYQVTGPASGYLAGTVFGIGIGGILTLTPVAFADYFGRLSYGSIRGIALPVQILGQATGPMVAGILFDLGGNYDIAMKVFVGIALLAAGVALLARPPVSSKEPNQ